MGIADQALGNIKNTCSFSFHAQIAANGNKRQIQGALILGQTQQPMRKHPHFRGENNRRS
jgi:hypothetical protein